jgi:hypothetical protein
MAFTLTSLAFLEGETIPRQYTCDGDDLAPPLAWSDPPEGTRGFALVMDDPDAPNGTFTHWVLYDIPATATGLSAFSIHGGHAYRQGARAGQVLDAAEADSDAVSLLRKVHALLAQLGRESEFIPYLDSVRARFKIKRNFVKVLERARWT